MKTDRLMLPWGRPARWVAPSVASSVAKAALAFALAASAAPAWCGTYTVVIDNMQFSPATLRLRPGDQVVWINKDPVPHTVTAAGAFDSGSLAPGKSWQITMSKRGRYAYHCNFHPIMKAVLVVE
jgi:plastocyanin